jgi:hypothetical protein
MNLMLQKLTTEPLALDYFSGGVPAGISFGGAVSDLSAAIDRKKRGLSRINEICLIGLVSYFEAFCKDHFASIINIEPSLVRLLRDSGQDILIDPTKLLVHDADWRARLGFIVGERYDFGSAQKINAFFGSLLKVTPFSKDQGHYFEGLLRDRNLLVHNGGVVTTSYLLQAKLDPEVSQMRPFFDSLVVTPAYLDERIKFLSSIARKTLKATHSALLSYVKQEQLQYSPERLQAVKFLLWWNAEEDA